MMMKSIHGNGISFITETFDLVHRVTEQRVTVNIELGLIHLLSAVLNSAGNQKPVDFDATPVCRGYILSRH
jgi:hypothetical protein